MISGVSEPLKRDSEISITFLGIYGLGQEPIYIQGMDEHGKNVLFRNNLNMWIDEDTGISNHERETRLKSLDDIDIDSLFQNYGPCLEDKEDYKTKVRNAEPQNEFLAKKILMGAPGYYPVGMSPRYSPHYSMFDEPEFVKKVLAHLEKIV